MPKFKKKILKEDRSYHSPAGELPVNRDVKSHWVRKFGEFKGKKFDIPVFWNHQDDPANQQPVKRKGRNRIKAENQAGWLTDVQLADDGALELEFDIPGKEDAEKVANNVTKVSPVIWDKLTDGEADSHENIIGACDLVAHPVDNTQEDFEPSDALACSLIKMGLDGQSEVFEMANGMDDSESDETPEESPAPPTNTEAASQANVVKEVLAELAKHKIVLSKDTNETNILRHLHQALLTVNAQEENDMSEVEETRPEVAQLSLEDRNMIQRAERAHKHAENQHRDGVVKRLSALVETGRCTPAEAEAHQESTVAIKLNLDDEGNHSPTSVESWIESREAIPEGTFWSGEERVKKMNVEVVDRPSMDDSVSETEADEIVDSVFGKAQATA